MRNIIFVFAFLFTVAAVSAEPDIPGIFLPPNERHPILLLQELDDYIEGALISVGTERGLMTAAIAKNITSIVQVDYDPSTVRYNLINRELLKISKSRLDYFKLRMSLNSSTWKIRGAGTLLAEESNFEFFSEEISRSGFDLFHAAKPERDDNALGLRPFAGANYLFDDHAYNRVSRLAREGKIEVEQLDLADSAAVEALIAKLTKTTPISVFDISNAWWVRYAGHDATLAIAGNLALRNSNTRLVFTYRKRQMDWGYEAVKVSDPDLSARMKSHLIVTILNLTCAQNLLGTE